MEEEQILQQIREQNPEGLALLEARYGSFIHYIVRSVLSDFPDEIEDCINDLWLKFWDILPEYDPKRSSLKTYLARVTRNAALDRRRVLLRHKQHFEAGEPEEASVPRQFSSHSPTEEFLLKQEEREHLNQALRALSFKDLDLFLRKYYYLQTAEQIAAETGRTKRSVESRLARIKTRLAKALKEVR